MKIDIEIGDIILTGRFKNHPIVVKKFGTSDIGQPTVNGRQLLAVRIEKLLPKSKQIPKKKEDNMKKKAELFDQVAAQAFNDELEKIAAGARIPEGGLRTGLLTNDLTQLMDEETAKKVKEKYNAFKRTGPGILPTAGIGAISGSLIGMGAKGTGRPSGKGALIGLLALPILTEILTRSGRYDKQAVRAADKLIKGLEKTSSRRIVQKNLQRLMGVSKKQLKATRNIATDSMGRPVLEVKGRNVDQYNKAIRSVRTAQHPGNPVWEAEARYGDLQFKAWEAKGSKIKAA